MKHPHKVYVTFHKGAGGADDYRLVHECPEEAMKSAEDGDINEIAVYKLEAVKKYSVTRELV